IVVLLYQGRGVSIGEFFLIQGLFRITAFLFEIPSGYLSDVFSRRKILIIGAFVQVLSMSWLFFAEGFWGVLLCETGLGLASALFSGTKEAYAFDLLKRIGREKDYLRENGSIHTFSQVATFTAVLTGGALYAINENLVLGAEVLSALIALGIFMLLPELREVRRKVVPESSPWRDCLSIVKMSVKHPEIKWLMIFPTVYSGFTIILLWILQPVMQTALVPVALFGFFVGINQGSRAVFSKISHRLKKFLGVRSLLFICIGALFAGFAAAIAAVYAAGNMTLVYAITAFIAIIPATQSMYGLVFKDYIHHKIQSTERGTVLSVYSMFNMGISGLMMILAKPLLDNVGIVPTMLVCLVVLALILFPLKKVLTIKGIQDE
ncbi:MAG: MFS transporter, partial [Rickettsiales bacterium]|nr:MFS transporter [Rickettsiales bacterium]